MKDVTPEQLQAAKDDWSKANPGKTPAADDISGQAYQNFYNQALTDSGLGTGGKVQQAIQAATAAVQGLAGGDISKALAGASAPYIANVIGHSGLDDADKVLAHAAVNAALAAAQGNNALVGAGGAATAEMVGMIAVNAYGKPVSELSETEKQTVSALATLAAGLAGGLAGGSTADAAAGAQAGKTTVENNWLSVDEADRKKQLETKRDFLKQELTTSEQKELTEINQKDKTRDIAIKSVCTDGAKGGSACGALVGPAQAALDKYGEKVSYSLIYKDLYPQDAKNLEGILQGLDAGSISRDQAITAIAKESGKSWGEVATQYDSAMQAQAIAVALAGMKGMQAGKPAKTSKPPVPNADKNLNYVDEPPFNPEGTAGSAQPWSTKGRIKHVQLPNQGKIRFVPDSNYSSSNPLPRGPNNGYLDKFGNEWVKGPSRTAGQAFEWDVQLSPKGKAQLGWATRDGSHLNVSLDGRITHK